MKYLTFLPILVLILLLACGDVRVGRVIGAGPSPATAGANSADAAALASPVCESLRKELAAARTKLAADSSNLRAKGRAQALGALARDVCGLD